MPKKRIRVITKKQKITESKQTNAASLEQTVREPTFLPGRARRSSLPLLLPFGTPSSEQTSAVKPNGERTGNTLPETASREAFSYDRPGETNTGNGTTYRIPGATDQANAQTYCSAGEKRMEQDANDRLNQGNSNTNSLQDTSALGKQNQERYQTAQNSYQTSSVEKKNTKELGR